MWPQPRLDSCETCIVFGIVFDLQFLSRGGRIGRNKHWNLEQRFREALTLTTQSRRTSSRVCFSDTTCVQESPGFSNKKRVAKVTELATRLDKQKRTIMKERLGIICCTYRSDNVPLLKTNLKELEHGRAATSVDKVGRTRLATPCGAKSSATCAARDQTCRFARRNIKLTSGTVGSFKEINLRC